MQHRSQLIALLAALTATLLLSAGTRAQPGGPVRLFVAGKALSTDPQPYLDGQTLMAPLRECAEALGAKVSYNPKSGRVAIRAADGRLLTLRVKDRNLFMGERRVALERPVVLVNEKCVAPAEAVLEGLGARVVWDPQGGILAAYPRLKDIIVRGDQRGLSLELVTAAPVDFAAHTLTDPERIYVDLPWAAFPEGRGEGERPVGVAGVQRVRWGAPDLEAPTVRVVLDLAGRAGYEWAVADDKCHALLFLGEVDGDEPVLQRFRPALLAVETQQRGQGVVDVVALLSAPAEYQYDVLRNPPRVVVDLPEAVLQSQQSEAAGDGRIVSAVRLGQVGQEEYARIVLDMANLMAFTVEAAEDPPRLAVRFAPARLADKVIVVDPGHGGKDPGARGKLVREKDLNLDVALRLDAICKEHGLSPVFTRAEDVFLDLYDRPRLASARQADIFLSIHNNAWVRPNGAQGTETYYWRDKDKCLATVVHERLVAFLGRKDNGVRRGNFAVLRESPMPAALCEIAYVNHDEDEKLLVQPEFRQRAAQAIFEALRAYVEGPGPYLEDTVEREAG